MSDLTNKITSFLGGDYLGVEDIAASLSKQLGLVILCVQIAAAAIIFTLFNYQDVSYYDSSKYMIFRDIMVMLLLGFGYCK